MGGISMGGHATLEFARVYPESIRSACVIAGYYPEVQIEQLVKATSGIPMLFVHRRSDRCCPFAMIEKVYWARKEQSRWRRRTWWQNDGCDDDLCGDDYAVSEAWFSEGTHHGPSDEERDHALNWLEKFQW